MLNRFSKLREKRADGDRGFTLIELLVVVVILGILIAIAIPLYLNYRKGANDSAAKSDLRGAVSVLEQCNADNSAYPAATFTLTASGAAGSCSQLIKLSSGSSLLYTPSAAVAASAGPPVVTASPAGATYTIASTNSSGATKFYCYNSATGGSVSQVSAATTLATATC